MGQIARLHTRAVPYRSRVAKFQDKESALIENSARHTFGRDALRRPEPGHLYNVPRLTGSGRRGVDRHYQC